MPTKNPAPFKIEVTLEIQDPKAFSKSRLAQDVEMFESQGYVVKRVRRVYP